MKWLFSISLIVLMSPALTQDLPFRSTPDYPEEFTEHSVAARMIDALGFRYYWATESLRPEDLDYRPSEDARSSYETIEHIYSLSQMLLFAVKQQAQSRSSTEKMGFEELRAATLHSLEEASILLKQSDAEDMGRMNIVFERGENSSSFPFWNAVNGPLADALTHVGQLVSFRRASGNPIDPKVSVFLGRRRE